MIAAICFTLSAERVSSRIIAAIADALRSEGLASILRRAISMKRAFRPGSDESRGRDAKALRLARVVRPISRVLLIRA